MSAMYVKSQNDKMQMTCQACGVKGHLTEKCWTVVGYPKWHSRHGKGIPRNPVKDQVGTSSHTPKWNAVKNNYPKMAASAQRNESGLPQGYHGIGSKIKLNSEPESSLPQNVVCQLKKSLYGLKQAPRQWFSKLSETLIKFGYIQSKADYSLFTKTTQHDMTIILVYVDDLLISGSIEEDIRALKDMMSNTFHMKDLGELKYFLGLEIDRTAAGFFISHKKYAEELLKEHNLTDCKPLQLPMDPNLKLTADKGDVLPSPTPYQRLVGRLIYLTITRPDISFTVQFLSQFMQQPTSVHMQAAIRLLRYISGNVSQGVLLASSSGATLTAYCDSDWASCPISRRSTTGYCIFLGHLPVSWKAKKESVVARSSAEAEYRAMALTACEVTWLTTLLQDLGLELKEIMPLVQVCILC
ncbi:hypothetical protein SOVF_116290 [Spinacia oleracea]|nr:hypothetical protein SOVF_116290 [Spinacia oleracea]